jgi:hypothetical protein
MQWDVCACEISIKDGIVSKRMPSTVCELGECLIKAEQPREPLDTW